MFDPRKRYDYHIYGELVVVNVESNPEFRYEALSYEWNSESHTSESIFINDQMVTVGANLVDALKRIREQDNEKCLWIDAICINQRDLGERNRQVALMGLIYSQAQRVIVWLGPERQESDKAMKVLARCTIPGIIYGPGHAKENLRILCPDLVGRMDTWRAVKKLLTERTYWKRVWIVQEIVLAQKITLCCGSRSAPWEALDYMTFQFENDLEELHGKILMPENAISQFLFAFLYRNRLQRQNAGAGYRPLDIFGWLNVTKDSCCAVRRDKLYGILAIAYDGDEVKVDYVKSDLELLRELSNLYPDDAQLKNIKRLLQLETDSKVA